MLYYITSHYLHIILYYTTPAIAYWQDNIIWHFSIHLMPTILLDSGKCANQQAIERAALVVRKQLQLAIGGLR